MNAKHRIEDLLRKLAQQVLGTLVRLHSVLARSESARRRREETLAALERAADQEDPDYWIV